MTSPAAPKHDVGDGNGLQVIDRGQKTTYPGELGAPISILHNRSDSSDQADAGPSTPHGKRAGRLSVPQEDLSTPELSAVAAVDRSPSQEQEVVGAGEAKDGQAESVSPGEGEGKGAGRSPTRHRRNTRPPNAPPPRHSSLSVRRPNDETTIHQESEEKAGPWTQSAHSKGDQNVNALLNLPPPLPFDLSVSNLWVGVPHRGPSS